MWQGALAHTPCATHTIGLPAQNLQYIAHCQASRRCFGLLQSMTEPYLNDHQTCCVSIACCAHANKLASVQTHTRMFSCMCAHLWCLAWQCCAACACLTDDAMQPAGTVSQHSVHSFLISSSDHPHQRLDLNSNRQDI